LLPYCFGLNFPIDVTFDIEYRHRINIGQCRRLSQQRSAE
jgi:hypothetical protein